MSIFITEEDMNTPGARPVFDEGLLLSRGFTPLRWVGGGTWKSTRGPARSPQRIAVYITDGPGFSIDLPRVETGDPNNRYERFIKPAVKRLMDANTGSLIVWSGLMSVSLLLPEDLEPVLLAVLDDVLDVLSKRP